MIIRSSASFALVVVNPGLSAIGNSAAITFGRQYPGAGAPGRRGAGAPVDRGPAIGLVAARDIARRSEGVIAARPTGHGDRGR